MVYTGTDLKFRITANIAGFDLTADGWFIEIVDRWGHTKYNYPKESCMQDTVGQWYFSLPKLTSGIYYAVFTGGKVDEDYSGGVRNFTDRQKLCTVGVCDCGCHDDTCCCNEEEEHAVTYEQVWLASVKDGSYLCDKDGNPILTGDGKRIYLTGSSEDARVRLNMSGEEFRNFMEGRSKNGQIDTIPEVLDALGRLDDDTAIGVLSDDEAQEMTHEILGDNAFEPMTDEDTSDMMRRILER